MSKKYINICSVGDISFRGRYENAPDEEVFVNAASLFSNSDFVIGNLESPLTPQSAIGVSGKCNLRGDVEWAKVLKRIGIDLVTLANNHIMDYKIDGFTCTINSLTKAGIQIVGAGMDLVSACKPVICTINNHRLAVFGRSLVEVSSPCYATSSRPGVAFLDLDELKKSIADIRNDVDSIIILLHWGMEQYSYPTPKQRSIAREIISMGANMIFGHHPHVIQGHEYINGGFVSYSSGNFFFDDFTWSINDQEGNEIKLESIMTEKNREGLVLQVNIDSNGKAEYLSNFTRINESFNVTIDSEDSRKQKYYKLSKRLGMRFYSSFWIIYSIKREWDLRLRNYISPTDIIKNIHKIRFRHFKVLFTAIRRSSKITSGKSTNPYEG